MKFRINGNEARMAYIDDYENELVTKMEKKQQIFLYYNLLISLKLTE